MSARDQEQRWSFAEIAFPVETSKVKGGIRDHVHEYWKTDGGDPEKGGRKLYTIDVTANFQDRFKLYPDLYPNGLDKLVRLWELSRTADLVVPFWGTLKAYAVDWTSAQTARVRSGQMVEITFREEGTQTFTIELTENGPKSIATGASSLAAVLDQADLNLPAADKSIFDQIQALANSIVAISDTAALYGQLVSAKVAQLMNLCGIADRIGALQASSSQSVVEALHDLWASSQKLAEDVQSRRQKLSVWRVTSTMSVQQLSQAIYADSSHVDDLLSLNTGTIRDPFVIPAGITVVYYAAS